MTAVRTYVEFLRQVEMGMKKIPVTGEFFEWMKENLDLLHTTGTDGKPRIYYAGAEVYIEE